MNQQPPQGNYPYPYNPNNPQGNSPYPYNPNSQPGNPPYPYNPNSQPEYPSYSNTPNNQQGNPSYPNIPNNQQANSSDSNLSTNQSQENQPSSQGNNAQNPQQSYGQQWNAAPNFNTAPAGNQPVQQGKVESSSKKDKKKTSKKQKKSNGSVVGWIFLGIFLMLILAGLGAYMGYQAAINARQAEYKRQVMVAAAEQYQMAIADIQQGNYANAKTRLDYVIEVDSNYPGAMETYQQVILALYPTASPTPMMTSTPEPTPTADTRGEEEMFQSIQQAMYAQNWEYAISLITALRDRNINYRGLEVDGMYYIALRNYGMQQINLGYLENGVYNIALAEALGPIDNQADSLRNAARAYLAGAGFWEINWSKALEYYSNAAQVSPNMYDRATMMTANQRYAEASFHVADEYVAQEDYCGAIAYYEQGLPIAGNETVQMTATAVYLVCYPPAEEVYNPETPSQDPNNSENYYEEEPDYGEIITDEEIYFGG